MRIIQKTSFSKRNNPVVRYHQSQEPQSRKQRILNESAFEKVQTALQKNKTKSLDTLVKTLYLQNDEQLLDSFLEPFPQYWEKVIKTLKKISKEAIFEPTIVFHSSVLSYLYAPKESGELHCIVGCAPIPSKFPKKKPQYQYYIEYTIFDANQKMHKGRLNTIVLKTNGCCQTHKDDPDVLLFLTQQLQEKVLTDGWPVSNKQLILTATERMEHYYYRLAHRYFLECKNAATEQKFNECLEKAIQAALHLSRDLTQAIEDDFSMNFKIMLVESYLAGMDGDAGLIPKALLPLLENSAQNPEAVYTSIRQAKQQQDDQWISAVMQCAPDPIVYSQNTTRHNTQIESEVHTPKSKRHTNEKRKAKA